VSTLALQPGAERERGRRRAGARPGSGGSQAGPAGLLSGTADLGGEPTLDALLAGVWEGLAAHKPAACPLCAGHMRPDYGVHALPVGGCCESCGTRLS
jgi:hypothetical protein